MSYSRKVGDMTVNIVCASDPETTFAQYSSDIEKWIQSKDYTPKTTMENLIDIIVLSFDCDDNYGEYDPETGCGGYGEKFTLEECKRYVEENGGFREFDYYA